MDIQKLIGNKLKEFRKIKKMSQEKLSEAADVDISYISEIENGYKNLSIVILEKLAKGLEINITDFFEAPPKEKVMTTEERIKIIVKHLPKMDEKIIESIYNLLESHIK